MAEWFWVDGVEGAQVPPDDRGLNLADGVFETIRVEQGQLMRPDLHRNRLSRGLKVLGFADAAILAPRFIKDAAGCAAIALPKSDGTVRLTVTRGSGPRGYAPPGAVTPRVIIRVSEGLPRAPRPGVLTVSHVTWPDQPVLAGCKLLARIEQVVALEDAARRGYDDAVMVNADGLWQSTCTGNLFLRMGDTLFTPSVVTAGIAGTRRKAIIDSWAQSVGLEIHVEPLTMRMATLADEAFSCNAVMGIRSIASIDDFRFTSFRAAGYLQPLIHRTP